MSKPNWASITSQNVISPDEMEQLKQKTMERTILIADRQQLLYRNNNYFQKFAQSEYFNNR